MPTVDIGFKWGGFWYDPVKYHNIEGYALDNIDNDNIRIAFYHTNKKGIRQYHEYIFPKSKLIGIHIRRIE